MAPSNEKNEIEDKMDDIDIDGDTFPEKPPAAFMIGNGVKDDRPHKRKQYRHTHDGPGKRSSSWRPLDYAVMLLTFVISFVVMAAAVSPLITGNPLVEAKSSLLSNLINYIVMIIIIYFIFQLRLGERESSRDELKRLLWSALSETIIRAVNHKEPDSTAAAATDPGKKTTTKKGR